MLLNQVKELINSNENLINELTQTKSPGYVFDFLKECISLIEKKDESRIDRLFLQEYKYTILNFTDAIIRTKTSQSEKVVIRAIAELLYNISVKYSLQDCIIELNALIVLSETSRSLEDILYALTFVFSKLNNQLQEEPSSSFLSRKYYMELSDFLESRKSHDEEYNI